MVLTAHHIPWLLSTLNHLWNTAAVIACYEIVKNHLAKRAKEKQHGRR